MSDYLVTESPGGGEVTLWEVENVEARVGPDSLPLLTVVPERARRIAVELRRVADEVAG